MAEVSGLTVSDKASRIIEKLLTDGTVATAARGGMASLVVRVAALAAAFGLQLLVARLFGAKVFGEYVYALAWVNVAALGSAVGMETAAVRFIPAARANNRWGEVRGFIVRSTQIVAGVSLLFVLVASIVIAVLQDRLESHVSALVWISILLLPVLVLQQVLAAQLRGLERPVLAQTIRGLVRPGLIAGALFVIVATHAPRTSHAVLLVNVLGTGLCLVLTWWFVYRILRRGGRGHRTYYRTADWLRVSIPLYLISGFQLVLVQTDILMLGALIDTTQAGVYMVATVLASLVAIGIHAANTIVAPLISRLYAEGRRHDLQRVMTASARGVTAYGLPAALSIALLGPIVLPLFGTEFVIAYLPMLVLLVGQLVLVTCGSVGFLLTMTAHERTAAWVIGGSAVLNIILNALFIPPYGLMGAAVATSIAVSMRSVVLSVIVYRKLGIIASVFRWS